MVFIYITANFRDRKDEARVLAFAKRPFLATVGGTLQKHMNYKREMSKKRALPAANTKDNVHTFIIGISLFIIFAITLISIVVRRSILSGVDVIRDGMKTFVLQKELSFRMKYKKNNEFKEISESFNDLANTLEGIITDVKSSSNENARNVEEIASAANHLYKLA